MDEESFISSFEDCKKVTSSLCLISKYQSQGDNILRARARGGAEQSACNLEHHWWQWGLETEDRGGYQKGNEHVHVHCIGHFVFLF